MNELEVYLVRHIFRRVVLRGGWGLHDLSLRRRDHGLWTTTRHQLSLSFRTRPRARALREKQLEKEAHTHTRARARARAYTLREKQLEKEAGWHWLSDPD